MKTLQIFHHLLKTSHYLVEWQSKIRSGVISLFVAGQASHRLALKVLGSPTMLKMGGGLINILTCKG